MDGRRSDSDAVRRAAARVAAAAAALLWILGAGEAAATLRYGDIQISGNLSAQNLFRIQNGSDTFSAFYPVQQRNTLRLQYEHQLAKGGDLLNGVAHIPFVDSLNFFLYYRFVYDSIFDIAPGPFLETGDGSKGGKISDIGNKDLGYGGGARRSVAFENNIREVFLDIKTTGPVSFRIGRQQIVWGEALSFRALDSVNAVDLSWHLQQEAGLLGKVGFDELRIPAWTIKMLADLGDFGPLSNMYAEIFDIPFDFQPAYARFEPAPWSIPVRNPIRGGLVADLNQAAPGTFTQPNTFVQPCFDFTGNPQGSSTSVGGGPSTVDFSDAARTGICNTMGLNTSNIRQGLYKRRDVMDVNQVGGRFGANAYSVGFTLNYLYRRQLGADIPGAGVLRTPIASVNANSTGFIEVAPHDEFDPITRRVTPACTIPFAQTNCNSGYLRLPAEWYYPYVHVVGASANYFDEFLTSGVWATEATFTKGLPIATLDPSGFTVKKKDVILGAVSLDRPTWIRFLNPRSTWLLITQLDYNYILDHEDVKNRGIADANGQPTFTGDVGLPNLSNPKLIPGLTDDHPRVDRLKAFEALTIVAASTFYRGGSFAPLLAWVADWANAPSMAFIAGFDYLPMNSLIITPTLAIYTNFGRTVDEPWGVGRLSQADEFRLKVTYQF